MCCFEEDPCLPCVHLPFQELHPTIRKSQGRGFIRSRISSPRIAYEGANGKESLNANILQQRSPKEWQLSRRPGMSSRYLARDVKSQNEIRLKHRGKQRQKRLMGKYCTLYLSIILIYYDLQGYL